MSLGKRWITTLESDGDVIDFRRDLWMTKDAALTNSEVDEISKKRGWRVNALEVNLDDLPRVDFTDEELAMYWERIETKAAEQRAKYWHAVQPMEGSPDARTLTVVWAGEFREQDVEVRNWNREQRGGQHVGMYAGIIAIHKPTGVAVIRDDERSQIKNKQAAIAELRKLVEPKKPAPVACSGCGGAESVCNCECGYHPCGCSCHQLQPGGSS